MGKRESGNRCFRIANERIVAFSRRHACNAVARFADRRSGGAAGNRRGSGRSSALRRPGALLRAKRPLGVDRLCAIAGLANDWRVMPDMVKCPKLE